MATYNGDEVAIGAVLYDLQLIEGAASDADVLAVAQAVGVR